MHHVVQKVCNLVAKDFHRSTLLVKERLGRDAAYIIGSTKARGELGWSPSVEIDERLAYTVAWINENWDAIQKEQLEYEHRS